MVQKVYCIVIALALVFAASLVTNNISQRQFDRAATEFENRIGDLEVTNNRLRDANQRAEEHNLYLRESLEERTRQLAERQRNLDRAREIVEGITERTREARDTIERIEIIIDSIEQLILAIGDEKEPL